MKRYITIITMLLMLVAIVVHCNKNTDRQKVVICNSVADTTHNVDTSVLTEDRCDTITLERNVIRFELTEDISFFSTDSTKHFKLLKGCIVYVDEDDNPLAYNLLKSDAIDDREKYMNVLIRMGWLNDTTEVKGYVSAGTLQRQKRLR